MGAMKNYLEDQLELLEAGKYKELLLEAKRWDDPTGQLWAVLAWHVAFGDPETGYIDYEKDEDNGR